MELASSKLVSKELKLSFVSLVFLVKIYPVLLPHEISEYVKWELIENYSIFDMFFWHFCLKYPL